MGALATQRELHVRFQKKIFVTQRVLLAEQTVIRSRAEGQIMAVDATLWSARDFDFVKLFFQPAAVAGRKLDSRQQNR